MVNSKLEDAITRAKFLLTTEPYDIYHTVEHSAEVVSNILEIVKREQLEIDIGCLEVAAWWHDVFKGKSNENELIICELKTIGIEDEEIIKIVGIQSSHSFGNSQQSLEEKLLYDADKLALVSVSRWKRAFEQYDNDLISREERDRYVSEWNKRMPILEDTLNLETSKQTFREKYAEFVIWLKSIDRYQNDRMI